MARLHEFTQWSIVTGGLLARLSMFDEAGQEFFILQPKERNAGWRDKKQLAREMLEEAMRCGCAPGRVMMSED